MKESKIKAFKTSKWTPEIGDNFYWAEYLDGEVEEKDVQNNGVLYFGLIWPHPFNTLKSLEILTEKELEDIPK